MDLYYFLDSDSDSENEKTNEVKIVVVKKPMISWLRCFYFF